MKNTALKTAGLIFILMSAAQAVRFFLKIQVTANAVDIPIWISAIAAAVLLALAIWMFKTSCK